ncbi:Uncharacterised protein [Mycobacteroides abscessus subsp. massiliense]|uniref:Lipoprotein LpqN n=1 Tax=Mycobacteroides abscessus TaxID=36809 RepID=A0A0U0ZRN9_9MYCO|nr:Uncharacterised protein [Mycobacteroides abscessus]SKM38021.1 Uncharacterised protein [Mycobacteroides abscessus subsp. massiliense]SKS82581.1 Uncharacterised protein [Mycobacteroides abscessus subsp. abscessus]SKN59437.1 Uncharacterised protein [Mycobacteroides abscessus subsp. massiliense]SKQ40915.1 Uncharacterised protein [Mycobacteroides abscessus subsp. massiliense]
MVSKSVKPYQLALSWELPTGWVPLVPEEVSEPGASVVLAKADTLDDPFTTNITVAEQIIAGSANAVDLQDFADQYTRHLANKVEDFSIIRAGLISDTAPVQFGQEFQFRLEVGLSKVDVQQSRIILMFPIAETESSEPGSQSLGTADNQRSYLVELTLSAAAPDYEAAKQGFADFVNSAIKSL